MRVSPVTFCLLHLTPQVAEQFERELTYLGITGVRDKLQAYVPETLELMMEAGIRVWIATGTPPTQPGSYWDRTGIVLGIVPGSSRDHPGVVLGWSGDHPGVVLGSSGDRLGMGVGSSLRIHLSSVGDLLSVYV